MSLEAERFKQIAFKDLDEIVEAKIKAEAMRKDKEAEKHAEQEAATTSTRRVDRLGSSRSRPNTFLRHISRAVQPEPSLAETQVSKAPPPTPPPSPPGAEKGATRDEAAIASHKTRSGKRVDGKRSGTARQLGRSHLGRGRTDKDQLRGTLREKGEQIRKMLLHSEEAAGQSMTARHLAIAAELRPQLEHMFQAPMFKDVRAPWLECVPRLIAPDHPLRATS